MDDLIFIALGLCLFLLAAAFVRACEALKA
jgi:hypothetical protein